MLAIATTFGLLPAHLDDFGYLIISKRKEVEHVLGKALLEFCGALIVSFVEADTSRMER